MTYQEVTGTLNPWAHPGSYNGQNAYNDMLVVDNEVLGRWADMRNTLNAECRGGAAYAR